MRKKIHTIVLFPTPTRSFQERGELSKSLFNFRSNSHLILYRTALVACHHAPFRSAANSLGNSTDHPLRIFQLTFPYPQNFPPQPSQSTVDRSIPFPVALNLCLPEGPVLLGQPETPGAAVPEATVYKDCHLLPAEREVRPARDRQMPSPAPYTFSPHQPGKPSFGSFVPLALDPGHDPRSLRL